MDERNHIVRNGIMVARELLAKVDHRLAGMEKDLALLEAPPDKDPRIRLCVPRLEDHNEGSLGVLLFDGRLFCFTLEPDSRDPVWPRIPAGMSSPHAWG